MYFGTNDAIRQNHKLLHMHFDVIIPSVSILNISLAGLTALWTLKTKNGMLSYYYTKRCSKMHLSELRMNNNLMYNPTSQNNVLNITEEKMHCRLFTYF